MKLVDKFMYFLLGFVVTGIGFWTGFRLAMNLEQVLKVVYDGPVVGLGVVLCVIGGLVSVKYIGGK